MDFFTNFTHEKTPQNNFSCENFSVENNYFPSFHFDFQFLIILILGTNYSVDKLKKKYYHLKSQQKYFTLPAKHLIVDDFEIQRLKAEKARENAENMTEKAEEAKKRRIELELEVLEVQKQREKVLLEVAKAKLTKSKY